MAEAIKTMSESLGESGTKTSAVVSASLMQGTSFLAQSLRQGTKITTSFLHDAVQVALDRDSGGEHEEAHEEPLPPLSVPTSWVPRTDTGAASSGDAERLLALAAETEACIVQGLAECDRRAREIREAKVFGELGALQDGASLPEGAQGVLTRVLACLRFPRTPGSPEETEPWEADGCRLVREWAARVGVPRAAPRRPAPPRAAPRPAPHGRCAQTGRARRRWARRRSRRRRGSSRARRESPLPLPRTNRTSLVPPLVLSGHVASLTSR